MLVSRTVITLAALAFANNAIAQTSSCMKMGDGMVHCNNMGSNGSMSSSDCMSIGGGMVSCNTMDLGGAA